MHGQHLAQRVEQQCPRLRHAAADDDAVQVAHGPDRGDHRRDRRRSAPERLQRYRVSRVGGVGQLLGVGIRRRVPAVLAGPPRHVRARRDRLHTAAATARAGCSVRLDDDVADVPGIAGAAVVGRAVEHQTPADARRHHHAEQEMGAAARAAPPLTHAPCTGRRRPAAPAHRPIRSPARRSESVATAVILIGLMVPDGQVDRPRRRDARRRGRDRLRRQAPR